MSDKDLSEKVANEQLMSCPFCGGKAQVSEHVLPVTRFLSNGRRRITSEFKYGITCQKCGAMSSQYYETMGEAVNAWNYRVHVPHEMSAREFLTAYKRMCASYPETDCIGCPLHTEYKDCMDAPCEWDIDKILPAVEQWAREHPERSEE